MTQSAASPDKPVVAADRLTKVFKDFWLRDRARAVDNLTFEINRREIFGLLGPNGSGKSTTIKMILGLLRPTSGRLAVFGKLPSDVFTKKRIGFLPEESYLYGFLNARETLDYYGKLFGLTYRDRQKRIEELLDMVGLTQAQFRPVREYSKGMQRRIGLAQALINDPEFLILDEPTTGLDPLGTRQVKDLIIELGRRGKTILLSSHLLADVEDCVDRMVILYGGKKRDEGMRDDLLVRNSRTTIESELLDDETIAEIDRIIRERTGGQKSILTVSHPRQKLEEKFLEIVERARAEKLETSGATHGGEVAAFLRGTATGERLIEELVSAVDDAPPPPEVEEPVEKRKGPDGPDASVIGDLLKQADADPERTPEPAQRPAPSAPAQDGKADRKERPADDRVDLDVIGSLLDSGEPDKNDGDGQSGRERKQ
ncbi:MAG: ABC transporter ATP-binding protein [Phycisphaerales bacterium]|nr:ABC transporter ATP-binding protein [Phycisphaerales bacterium]